MQSKILIICYHPYSYMGGATAKIVQLLNGLDKNNFKIVYVYLKKNCELNFDKNINVIKVKAKSTLFSFFKIKQIL